MKRFVLPFLLSLALVAGCLGPSSAGISYVEQAAGKTGVFRIEDPSFHVHIRCFKAGSEMTQEGFLRAVVGVENSYRRTFRCAYRFVWLDENELEMRHARTPWRPLRLHGRGRRDLEGVAPVVGAVGFRIELRPRDDETDPDSAESLLVDMLELMKTDKAFLSRYQACCETKTDGRLPRVAVGRFEDNTGLGRNDAYQAGTLAALARTALRKTELFTISNDTTAGSLHDRNQAMNAIGEGGALVGKANRNEIETPDYYLLGEIRRGPSGAPASRALHLEMVDAADRSTVWEEVTTLPVP